MELDISIGCRTGRKVEVHLLKEVTDISSVTHISGGLYLIKVLLDRLKHLVSKGDLVAARDYFENLK